MDWISLLARDIIDLQLKLNNFKSQLNANTTLYDYLNKKSKLLSKNRKLLRRHRKKYDEQRYKYINRNITKRDISKGDLVLYYTWDRVKGIQRKHYTLLYSGPYKVIRRKRNTKVIEIENVKNKKERLFVNVDRLKKYYTPAVNKI